MIRIEPSDSDIAWWMHTFVPERALWLWDNSPIPHEERADRVIAPSELRSDPDAGSIQAVNAFHLWAISPETTRVIIESGQWLAELSDTDQSRAQALQVKLNRGMCVPRDRFPLISVRSITPRMVERSYWTISCGNHFPQQLVVR